MTGQGGLIQCFEAKNVLRHSNAINACIHYFSYHFVQILSARHTIRLLQSVLCTAM